MVTSNWRRLVWLLVCLAGLVTILICLYLFKLNQTILDKFEGRRWDIPARIYARPLELYPGLMLTPDQLEEELLLAGYRLEIPASNPGSYDRNGLFIHLRSRPFNFGDSQEPGHDILLAFEEGQLKKITATGTGDSLPLVRLDPAQIGSFHPILFEDRILLSHEEIPDLLRETLIAVEDNKFYSHVGIDFKAIVRAMWTNIRAGRIVQGGSTITQQLVKNFFLHNRRTLLRKMNEAAMAMLLELHYDKEEILTAYANEVYLGQDGNRAIHGFALASHFYFRRDLENLTPGQIALLVGLVKGPSYYNPWLHLKRSQERRAVILKVMKQHGLISQEERMLALAAPESKAADLTSGINRFPSFLDLVKRQLAMDYHEKDLTSSGIKILTSFDPMVQRRLEEALDRTLSDSEETIGKEELQAAVVVASRDHGEIQAMAGDRRAGFAGFNRALDALRPIGSLVKPAVYLTALRQGYTLATPLQDTAVELTNPDGTTWQPENFNRHEHGTIPLFRALSQSYNLATIHMGMDIGLDKVIATLKQLGVTKKIQPYPSMVLGAISMTPLEVAQMYQILANGGFYAPLRTIRTVLDADNKQLKRYPVTIEQRVDPAHVFLVNTALQHAVLTGTGKKLARFLPPDLKVAGKTGTSDKGRDSWFAGFTGDRLAVIWVGRDDNQAQGLTGATDALPVWGRLMNVASTQPLDLLPPPDIQWKKVKSSRYDEHEAEPWDYVVLPFLPESVPVELVDPVQPAQKDEDKGSSLLDRIKDLFH